MRIKVQTMIIRAFHIILFLLLSCGSSKNKPEDNIIKNVKAKDSICFFYTIHNGESIIEKKAKENIIVNADTLRFRFCRELIDCNYKYSLKVVNDSLKVIENCDYNDYLKRKKCQTYFCVYCIIKGLRNGVYDLSFVGNHRRIEVK